MWPPSAKLGRHYGDCSFSCCEIPSCPSVDVSAPPLPSLCLQLSLYELFITLTLSHHPFPHIRRRVRVRYWLPLTNIQIFSFGIGDFEDLLRDPMAARMGQKFSIRCWEWTDGSRPLSQLSKCILVCYVLSFDCSF